MMARHRKRKYAARAAHAAGRDKRERDAEQTADERRNVARDHRRAARREVKPA
jgi:hypothetical protein